MLVGQYRLCPVVRSKDSESHMSSWVPPHSNTDLRIAQGFWPGFILRRPYNCMTRTCIDRWAGRPLQAVCSVVTVTGVTTAKSVVATEFRNYKIRYDSRPVILQSVSNAHFRLYLPQGSTFSSSPQDSIHVGLKATQQTIPGWWRPDSRVHPRSYRIYLTDRLLLVHRPVQSVLQQLW